MIFNKGPKASHIVHLSTMYHLYDRSARRPFLFLFPDWFKQEARRAKYYTPEYKYNVSLFLTDWPGRPSCCPNWSQKKTLRACLMLSFVEFCSAVSEEKSKMFQPVRGRGGHLVFAVGPKNTNLVEDVEILLPVKFR